MSTICISVTSRKGGVGKTTSTISLGGAFVSAGKRVLLIDFDPQASLTSSLLGAARTDALPVEQTVAALFGDEYVAPAKVILPTEVEGLSLLPGSEWLEPVNCVRCNASSDWQFALRDFLAEDAVAANFDRVLIDGPPSLQGCSWAAMQAADCVLMPLQADAYGAQSIRSVNTFIERVKGSGNPRLKLLGYLRTVYRQTVKLQIGYSDGFAREFPGCLLNGFIPMATQFQEAVNNRKPISHYKPKCAAAKAVAQIVEEMEARLRQGAAADHQRMEAA